MAQVLDFRIADTREMGIVARIRQAIADYRLYLATLNELQQLNDRDLADLGIHRAMIREIARESVYGA